MPRIRVGRFHAIDPDGAPRSPIQAAALASVTVSSEARKACSRNSGTLTTIGGGQQEQVNVASIYVKMTPIEERKVSQQELMVRARNEVLGKYLKQYPGQLRTSVQQVAAISGGGKF